jgi:molybdopterin synthase catalytic subunit
MTEKQLGLIVEEAFAKWMLLDALLLHRVGELKPQEPIVLVAVWSAHRKDAFEACRYLMEALKSRAPFWKREQLNTGHRWVEKNTEGY